VISTRFPSNGAPCRNVRNAVRPATGCSGKADSVGQYGDSLRRHRGAFGPAQFIHQRDNASARWRAAAVSRLPQHNAADVLAGYPALLVVAERGSPFMSKHDRRRALASFVANHHVALQHILLHRNMRASWQISARQWPKSMPSESVSKPF
jgi:hypothetical protein